MLSATLGKRNGKVRVFTPSEGSTRIVFNYQPEIITMPPSLLSNLTQVRNWGIQNHNQQNNDQPAELLGNVLANGFIDGPSEIVVNPLSSQSCHYGHQQARLAVALFSSGLIPLWAQILRSQVHIKQKVSNYRWVATCCDLLRSCGWSTDLQKCIYVYVFIYIYIY